MINRRGLLAMVIIVSIIMAGCAPAAAPPAKAPAAQPETKTAPVPGASPAAPAKAPQGEPVKIGWIGALTGLVSEFGIDAKNGVEVAVDEWNAKGGIKGRPIQVIYVDTQIDPQKARQAAERLITSDKVVAILGDWYTPNTAAALDLVDKAEVPMFSSNSAADFLVQGHKYFLRNVLAASVSAGAIFTYAVNKLGIKKYVIFASSDAYGQGNADAYVAWAKKLNVEIIGNEKYDRVTTKDFTNLLQKYKDQSDAGLLLGGGPEDSALIVKQIGAIGGKLVPLGAQTSARSAMASIGGNAALGTYSFDECPVDADDMGSFATPNVTSFMESFRAKFGKLPKYDAASAYDSANILFTAMQGTAAVKGSEIREQLLKVQSYPGVCGSTTMQPNGNSTRPGFIMKWMEGLKLRIVDRIEQPPTL